MISFWPLLFLAWLTIPLKGLKFVFQTLMLLIKFITFPPNIFCRNFFSIILLQNIPFGYYEDILRIFFVYTLSFTKKLKFADKYVKVLEEKVF